MVSFQSIVSIVIQLNNYPRFVCFSFNYKWSGVFYTGHIFVHLKPVPHDRTCGAYEPEDKINFSYAEGKSIQHQFWLSIAQKSGNFMIFLSLRFFVKSILGILEVQIFRFDTFRGFEFEFLCNFALFEAKNY